MIMAAVLGLGLLYAKLQVQVWPTSPRQAADYELICLAAE